MKTILITLSAILILMSIPLSGQSDNLSKAKDLIKDKKYDKAKPILEKVLDENEKKAEANYLLSVVYYNQGDIDSAEDYASKAVDEESENSQYHYWLGVCYGRDAQSASIFRKPFLASKTKSQFEKAVELDSSNINARVALARYYLMAPGIMGGDINKAIEQANIITKYNEIRGRNMLIDIFEKQNEVKKAKNEYEQLENKIGDEKKYYAFYNSYGSFLLKHGELNEAIEKFKKQVELAPDKANSYASLGEAYLKKGMLKEALAEYNHALQIDPNFKGSQEKVKEIKEKMDQK